METGFTEVDNPKKNKKRYPENLYTFQGYV